MNDIDLNKQRDVVIEEIKKAFPIKAPPKALVSSRKAYEDKILLELFDGKIWTELINHPDIIYLMSEVDYVRIIKDRTFLYYLPAFLITTLNEPLRIVYTSAYSKIMEIAPDLNVDKLQVLIAYFTYQEQFWHGERYSNVKLYEDLALKLLILLDEKKTQP